MSLNPAPANAPTDLTVFVEDRVTIVVSIRGSAGLKEAALLDREIDDLLYRDPMVVVLDLSGLRFITSLGVRALLRLYRDVIARGGRVSIAGAGGYVAEVLSTLRFERFMPMYPTVEAALRGQDPGSASGGTGPWTAVAPGNPGPAPASVSL